VVPLGLGGQASLQWTKPGIDAPDIIIRAIQLGVNYLDSANAYGPSQANYGEAFRRMNLQPADRAKLYIASKTVQRYAKNPAGRGATAIDDLKRSLTQMFGDGKGFIPEGAYLDAIQIHNLTIDQNTPIDDRQDRPIFFRTAAPRSDGNIQLRGLVKQTGKSASRAVLDLGPQYD
jgi:aryl-alcohol dehydrogenase-like predicted oxidoreductase